MSAAAYQYLNVAIHCLETVRERKCTPDDANLGHLGDAVAALGECIVRLLREAALRGLPSRLHICEDTFEWEESRLPRTSAKQHLDVAIHCSSGARKEEAAPYERLEMIGQATASAGTCLVKLIKERKPAETAAGQCQRSDRISGPGTEPLFPYTFD